jgi:hypothetical protein
MDCIPPDARTAFGLVLVIGAIVSQPDNNIAKAETAKTFFKINS